MKSDTTFRNYNETIYVRIPKSYADHLGLSARIKEAGVKGTKPECKIEDKSKKEILITFPKS